MVFKNDYKKPCSKTFFIALVTSFLLKIALFIQKENYTSLSRKRPPTLPANASFPLQSSLMWVQKGKLLSRWKERFIVVTEEYIQCFKKGLAQLSQMGDFIFQVNWIITE